MDQTTSNDEEDVKPETIIVSMLKKRSIKREPFDESRDADDSDVVYAQSVLVKEEISRSKPKQKKKVATSSDRWERLGRIKPNPSRRDYERVLITSATKGVVQLFNAIKEHQKSVSTQVAKAKTVRKTEKVLKSLKKDQFFERISTTDGGSAKKKSRSKKAPKKEEAEDESIGKTKNVESGAVKKWDVLNDDFLSVSKDWDNNDG